MTLGTRTVVSSILGASVTTGSGVAVNLATDETGNVWAWVAVGVLTALAVVLSVVGARYGADRGSGPTEPAEPTGPVVENSVILGGNVQIGRAGGDVTVDHGR